MMNPSKCILIVLFFGAYFVPDIQAAGNGACWAAPFAYGPECRYLLNIFLCFNLIFHSNSVVQLYGFYAIRLLNNLYRNIIL